MLLFVRLSNDTCKWAIVSVISEKKPEFLLIKFYNATVA